MPLTFEEAKLQVNPDPLWYPIRNSPEYHDIIKLMKQSGSAFAEDRIGTRVLEIPYRDLLKDGHMVQHLNNTIHKAMSTPATSKNNFVSIQSNKLAIENHIISNTSSVVHMPIIVPVTKETMEALKTKGILSSHKKPTKPMSKQEFLTMEDNREYIKHHVLINKNL